VRSGSGVITPSGGVYGVAATLRRRIPHGVGSLGVVLFVSLLGSYRCRVIMGFLAIAGVECWWMSCFGFSLTFSFDASLSG
jgi:hypothetical protein